MKATVFIDELFTIYKILKNCIGKLSKESIFSIKDDFKRLRKRTDYQVQLQIY
jgi:hypothetical protein